MSGKLVGGVNSRIIPDSAITASSCFNNERDYGQGQMWRARLDNCDTCWCAGAADANQWLQFDFGEPRVVSKVQTKGRFCRKAWGQQWVTAYKISYSLYGTTWLEHNGGEEFSGNTDWWTLAENVLDPPITARFIKLHPIRWHAAIAMRAELIGSSGDFPALVGSCAGKVIPDSAITASSCYHNDPRHGHGQMWRSRLDNTDICWCANANDMNQWIQWDLGAEQTVSRVQTMGRYCKQAWGQQWVTAYRLSYSCDASSWQWYNDGQELKGNTDFISLAGNGLEPPITARYVRLHPTQWHKHISMRAELFGSRESTEIHPMLYNLMADIFDAMDLDGDGILSDDEAAKTRMITSSGSPEEAERNWEIYKQDEGFKNPRITKEIWITHFADKFSKEHPGSDTYTSLVLGLEALHAGLKAGRMGVESAYMTRSQIIAKFQEYDANGDGKVELPELTEIMQTVVPSFSQDDVQRMFSQADADGDGFITDQEFIDWVFASTPDFSSHRAQAACKLEAAETLEEMRDALSEWYATMKPGLMGSFGTNCHNCEVLATCLPQIISAITPKWSLLNSSGDSDEFQVLLEPFQIIVDMLFLIQSHLCVPLTQAGPVFKECAELAAKLVTFGLKAGVKRAKYALIQARKLGVSADAFEEMTREMSNASPKDSFAGVSVPSYWDVFAMDGIDAAGGLTLSAGDEKNLFAKFDLTFDELKLFQSLFDATQRKVYTRDRRGGKVPDRLKVVKGQRIQNLQNWAEYTTRRNQIIAEIAKLQEEEMAVNTKVRCELKTAYHLDSMDLEFDDKANSCWLFHGTNARAANCITQGDFLVNLAGSNAGTLYGRGIYLAESCSKSDEYSEEDFEGNRCILVCRATLGNLLYNDERRPSVNKLVDQCVRGPYHSVLGDREKCRGTFKEIIVYDDDQVYPEFIIFYRREYK